MIEEITQNDILISKEEYEELKDNSEILNSLRGAGVDNWEGYDDAMERYRENK